MIEKEREQVRPSERHKEASKTDTEQPDWMEAWQIRAEQTHYTWSQ